MTRGTTPTYTLELPAGIDLGKAAQVYAAFEQGGERIVKTGEALAIRGNIVEVYLDQAETLFFTDGERVGIQLNWIYEDGTRASSRIASAPVRRNLIQMELEGGEGGSIHMKPVTLRANGTYTAPERTAYTPVTVDLPRAYGARF